MKIDLMSAVGKLKAFSLEIDLDSTDFPMALFLVVKIQTCRLCSLLSAFLLMFARQASLQQVYYA